MLERVREIIQEQLNLDGVEITEESSFKDDLGADSLDLFELVMAFEEEYGVEIPSEDLEQITTVGAVIEYMKSKGVEAQIEKSEFFIGELIRLVNAAPSLSAFWQ